MTQTIEQLSFYEKFCQSKFKNGIDRQEAISKDWEQLTTRVRELEEENARLKVLQQSSWQRGHAAGINGLNGAVKGFCETRESYRLSGKSCGN